jgi:hypothetical protein
VLDSGIRGLASLSLSLTAASLKPQHLYLLSQKDFLSATMSAQAPQSAHTTIWDPIYSPSGSSSPASDYISLETHSSDMRNFSLAKLTSFPSGGLPSESLTLDDTFLTTLSERCADIPTVQIVPRQNYHPRRTTKACEDCRRRKVRCGERQSVQFHEQ